MRKLFLVFILTFSFVFPALAVNPDEILDDPVLEERARDLSIEIRCLVCQNQSIDDSDAQLARDLRILVREKLVEGLDDEQILEYLVARYGEFVLLKPRLSNQTLLLWILPLFALVLGAIFALKTFRNAKRKASKLGTDLSQEEQEKLNKILGE